MSIGSLFSGIGGLELGLESCGLGPVRWQVECNEYCRQILARHWPDAARTVHDVRDAGGHNLAPVDVVCGGFPCQPVSLAGRREARRDERWLWPEYARVLGELGPRYVFVENVPGLLTADGGRAFGDVLGSLASLGYDAVWDCFRAADVGAPHKRERVFLLAYRHDSRPERTDEGRGGAGIRTAVSSGTNDVAYRHGDGQPQPEGSHGTERRRTLDGGEGRGVADTGCVLQQRRQSIDVPGSAVSPVAFAVGVAPDTHGGERPARCALGRTPARPAGGGVAQPGLGGMPHGLPGGMDGFRWPAGRGEPQRGWEPPRTAKGIAQRPARLKALGNAVVWKQAALAWRVLFEQIRRTS